MKALVWLMAFGALVLLLQYGLFKENGEPRSIPVMAVAK
jgi:hypothetical protein